jgi:hypothetical protein
MGALRNNVDLGFNTLAVRADGKIVVVSES